MLKTSLVMVN